MTKSEKLRGVHLLLIGIVVGLAGGMAIGGADSICWAMIVLAGGLGAVIGVLSIVLVRRSETEPRESRID